MFDIFLDALSEQVMGCSNGVGRLKDLIPWCLEDALRNLMLVNADFQRVRESHQPKLG